MLAHVRYATFALLVAASSAMAQPAPTSQPYVWKSVAVKGNGFIDGIVFHPAARGLVYIHTDMGGSYRLDGGRWTPLNDGSRWDDPAARNLGVETLAVDPTDADRVYMGIGTYMQPSAVLRSADRGRTWQRTDVPFEMNGNGSARNCGERMRVDPNAPNILFYGTRDDGLFKSVDHGATWTQVKSFPTIGHDEGWGKDTGILFVEFDKASASAGTPTRTIYAGVFEPTEGRPRIFRSLDAGETWHPLPGDQPTSANRFPQRCALAPDGRTLYLTYATSTTYPGPYGVSDGAVYKVSDPASDKPTWANVTPPATFAYSAVALDPTDARTIYAGELGDYRPADRIWRSTDAGATWAAINPNAHRDDASAPYARNSRVHWLGDLQIDPHDRDVAIFTTGYGLYRTTNLTAAEPRWTFFNEGFEQSAVLEIASPRGGPVNLFTAIGDRDGFRHVDFDASPADGLLGQNNGMARGTSDDIDVAWDDANVLVRCVRKPPFVQWSSDNGVTWRWVSEQNASGGNGGSVALSGDGTRVVYAPAGRGEATLLYATRTGDAWSAWQTAADAPARGAKLVVDLVDGRTFYAVAGRTVSRSTDGGEHWSVVSDGVAPARINWMRAVPGHAGHLVCSTGDSGNGVWRSTDGGATWNRLAPRSVTHAIAVGVGAAMPGKAYPSLFVNGSANGTTGYFRSDDEGATWTSISDAGQQYGYVTVIQGDPRVPGQLYVGTNGRGTLVGEPAAK